MSLLYSDRDVVISDIYIYSDTLSNNSDHA
jgi:hypothetical protein